MENLKVEVPKDSEGYIQSFGLDDPQGINDFFQEYGFVVINNVISNKQADAAINEIWEILEDDEGLKRNDRSTWETNWPTGKSGIVGNSLACGPAAWNIRFEENVYKAFKTVLNDEELLVSVDRYGYMRPTKGVEINGKKVDKPEWKTKENWFHWDSSPGLLVKKDVSDDDWYHYKPEAFAQKSTFSVASIFISENNEKPQSIYNPSEKVQGLVALYDSKEEDGGFITVPKMHKRLEEWVENNKKTAFQASYVSLPSSQTEVVEAAQKISMRRGSVVIWSSKMVHCNYPNDSSNPRACIYLKMFPKKVLPSDEYIKARAEYLLKNMYPGTSLGGENLPSALGQKLLGVIGYRDEPLTKIDI